MKRFARIAAKRERLVVGLMSGTSADGIDAALVRIRGHGARTKVETLAFRSTPYPDRVRSAVLRLAGARTPDVCRWNFELGEAFARAALAVIAKAKLDPADVDLVGSHGQTILHRPPERGRPGSTLQIGEPSVIAERTGLPVVADFRVRDMAVGGQGAPLVPFFDWLLLRPKRGARLALNLGGVANVTLVTQRAADVIAFDTGPANAPIDAAVRTVTRGKIPYDNGGGMARGGCPDEDEVRRLLAHPYFRRPPPKSLDRDLFGSRLVAALRRRRPDLAPADLVATVTRFVADSVADAIERHVPKDAGVVDLVVSGGGWMNSTLTKWIADRVWPLPVRSSAEFGIETDEKEAVAFAVLANESVCGGAGNLPGVTGAARPVVLGKFVP